MPYSYSRIRASDGLLSNNSSSYDTNGNIRVELSPTPRQRNSFTSREPLKLTSSSTINRSHTFSSSKAERPSHMIRSDTFILKHHSADDYSDEHNTTTALPTSDSYGTYSRSSRSKSKSRTNNNYSSDEKQRNSDDKSNYATYTRPPPKDKHYANMDSYRKSSRSQHRGSDDHHQHHRSYRSHSHDSTDRHHPHPHHQFQPMSNSTATLTRRSKPKRVESFIKKFDTINFWKRRDSKDKSPSPANNNSSSNTNGVNGDTLKRTKNIFNLIASSKKSTRDVGIECKLDQEERQEKYDYFDSSYHYGPAGNESSMGLRKSSVQSLNEEIPKYRRASSKPKVYEHGSTQLLTSIIKTPERRYYKSTTPIIASTTTTTTLPTARVGFDVKSRSKYTPSPPIDSSTYDDTRRRPVGVASPQPQIRSRSVLKNGSNSVVKKPPPPPPLLKSTRLLASIENNHINSRDFHDDDPARPEGDRMSFREYRERLLKAKNENNRRLVADNSDDELRKSHQQSFFVPI